MNILSCVTLASSVEAPRGPTSQHRALGDRQVAGFTYNMTPMKNQFYPKEAVL